jgi:hypothetical protein
LKFFVVSLTYVEYVLVKILGSKVVLCCCPVPEQYLQVD